MRRVVLVGGLIIGAFFIVRAIVELVTIDYSDPSSYANDWGGPSLAGVLLVHCGLGVIAAIAFVYGWRRVRAERRNDTSMAPRAVILVEGMSDRRALEALAARRGRDLTAEGVEVVAMDGATNIARFLERFGPDGDDVTVAGLYDVAEGSEVRRGLERAGSGSLPSDRDLERLGFFACVEDLEDELIRAVGVEGVLRIVEGRGELGPFRTLQKQPEWRGRPVDQQLRRFLGNSSRKIDYAPLLVAALDLSSVPRPLDAVLRHVSRST